MKWCVAVLALAACHEAKVPAASGTHETVALAGTGKASFDFIAYEEARERVWVPYARDAGFVDVYDIKAKSLAHVTGFGTREVEDDGRKRVLGPSAVAFGDGVAYIGNRGTNEICVVSLDSLKLGACSPLPAAPDCIVYVPALKELWVTLPKTNSVVVLDAATPAALAVRATIAVDGAPEGYALDGERGVFLTNLEDKNRTLRIDLRARTVISNWAPGCSEEGPRGLVADSARGLVWVACTDRVQVLDAKRDGAVTGSLETGAGVDDVFFAGDRVYVAAGKAARLTVAHADQAGHPVVDTTFPTVPRARNAVADRAGNVYVVDPAAPALLVFPSAR